MSSFFSPEEIKEITGLELPSSQEKFLKKLGLNVTRNKANRVILSRDAFLQFQLGNSNRDKSTREPKLKLKTNN